MNALQKKARSQLMVDSPGGRNDATENCIRYCEVPAGVQCVHEVSLTKDSMERNE